MLECVFITPSLKALSVSVEQGARGFPFRLNEEHVCTVSSSHLFPLQFHAISVLNIGIDKRGEHFCLGW